MTGKAIAFLFVLCFLTGCGSQTQVVPSNIPPASETATDFLATETPTILPFTPTTTDPTADPTIFGAILQTDIQAFTLEPVANAVFNKTMDGFIADGRIQEYKVNGVTIFPGSGGLLSEISFNIRTTDLTWLESDGAQAADNWITGKCYRFDFVTTETEFQLKNRRTCN
jgi:hypothetical protein